MLPAVHSSARLTNGASAQLSLEAVEEVAHAIAFFRAVRSEHGPV